MLKQFMVVEKELFLALCKRLLKFYESHQDEMYKIYRNGETTKKDTIDFLS